MNFLKEVVLHTDETKKEGSEAEKQVSSNQGLKEVIPFKKEESITKEAKDIQDITQGTSSLSVQRETVQQATILEKEVETPIIKETVIPQVEEVIQPILNRDTETTEVRHITQPLSNTEILPTQYVSSELPSRAIPDTIEKPSDEEVKKYYDAHTREADTRVVQEAQVHRTVLPPIIKERVTPVIHEEIQPVIYQETIQPVIITETKQL